MVKATISTFRMLNSVLKLKPTAAEAGPLGDEHCEPGQVRKEAAAAARSGAGVWLVFAATQQFRGDNSRVLMLA